MLDMRRGVLVLLAALAAVCACDTRRREANEPIEECMDYARAAERCLGDRAASRLRASFSIPPRDEAGRVALRARCIEQRSRIRHVCH